MDLRMIEGEVRIDTTLVPDHVRDDLAAVALNGVREYFRQPGVQEKYEQWLKQRREKKKGAME